MNEFIKGRLRIRFKILRRLSKYEMQDELKVDKEFLYGYIAGLYDDREISFDQRNKLNKAIKEI